MFQDIIENELIMHEKKVGELDGKVMVDSRRQR